MEIVHKRFINQILKEEAAELSDVQAALIRKKLQFNTGELINGISYDVGAAGAFGGRLTITHPIELRFQDIKRKVYDKATGRYTNRNNKIHNSPTMAAYNRIAYRLMYDMTEDVVMGIKKQLQNG